MEKPAPCLVATWPALAQVESNQEMLFLTDRSSKDFDQFRFKLGVMIVNRASKFVCVFRHVYIHSRVCIGRGCRRH